MGILSKQILNNFLGVIIMDEKYLQIFIFNKMKRAEFIKLSSFHFIKLTLLDGILFSLFLS